MLLDRLEPQVSLEHRDKLELQGALGLKVVREQQVLQDQADRLEPLVLLVLGVCLELLVTLDLRVVPEHQV